MEVIKHVQAADFESTDSLAFFLNDLKEQLH